VADFGLSSFNVLLSSLSPDAHIRGKQFERVAKWWLTQDPIRSLDVKQAWLWDEWPERSGRDIGIDIVAEMFDGTICAIQAKCFDENRDISKSELDSFVSAASHRTFQHRWLIATTDRLSANARRMLDDQHVTRIMRSDLEESLDTWPTSVDELNPIQQVKSSPRPHQNLAINDVVKGLASSNRGQLIMACGTGKTLTALWIKETLKPRTTLVLVPSLNLLAQTLSEWAKNTSSPWNYLCVCSDDTVNKADDQPISTVGDLPFDVTTNAEQISDFLSLGGEKIIFSTYQSSSQVAKAQGQSGVSFDLVICDEAHRLTGKTDADYATVLDEKKIVAEKLLFMTATPRTYTTAAKSKAEERGAEITSMDDEHVYGPVLHKLSFGEAIKQDLLSDYRVLIVGVTDPQVQDLIDRRELVSVNDAVTTDARTLAAHIGLAKATKDYNLKRTISFHSRIKSADQFARDHAKILDWLPDTHKPSGDTWTGTISGAMNTGDRRRLIKQLSLDGNDRHALLTNARCLTEGVDVPSLDGVAFIDPRSSQVDIIQAVGRAIRKSENKEIGTIVLPVLIPTDSDAEEALEDTAFKPIWAILNALKSHDDDFAAELSNLRTAFGKSGTSGKLPNRLIEDLPTDIDSILPGFSHKLTIAILENSTDSWEWWYGILLKYAEQYASSRVKSDEVFEGYRLGAWVASQRSNNNRVSTGRGFLSPERWNLLNELPKWTWDPIEDFWDEMYDAVTTHLTQNTDNVITYATIDGEGRSIGKWVSTLRVRYKTGRLTDRQIQQLEQLPGWSWQPIKDQWQFMYLKVKHLLEDKPLEVIKHSTIDLDGSRIGQWVISQRQRKKQGLLSTDEIAKLESLPDWSWNPNDGQWESSFELLCEFQRINGHVNPTKDDQIAGFNIGVWAGSQRQKKRNNQLSEAQIKMLGSLGFLWKVNVGHGEFFDSFIAHLELWIRQGGSPTPQQVKNGLSPVMEDGYRIAEQAIQARRAIAGRVKNVMPTEQQIKQLEALGFDFQKMRKKKLKDFQLAYRCINFESPISKATFDQYPVDEIATSSRLHVECICPDCGHTWDTAIRFLTGAETPCPNCRLRMPDPKGKKNPIANHPNWQFIGQYWDYQRNANAGIDPEIIGEGSNRYSAFLKCPDCNAEWQRKISILRSSFSCPQCSKRGRRFRPDVIAEMHRLTQEGISAEEIAKRFGVLPTVLGRLLLNQSDH
jgi:superfamily II DNA or RNA helicase